MRQDDLHRRHRVRERHLRELVLEHEHNTMSAFSAHSGVYA
jgi:hypothetical protein